MAPIVWLNGRAPPLGSIFVLWPMGSLLRILRVCVVHMAATWEVKMQFSWSNSTSALRIGAPDTSSTLPVRCVISPTAGVSAEEVYYDLYLRHDVTEAGDGLLKAGFVSCNVRPSERLSAVGAEIIELGRELAEFGNLNVISMRIYPPHLLKTLPTGAL